MRWARTLMLAQMLTKAIHANVSHEATIGAATTQWPKKESDMGDDVITPDTTTIDTATTDTPPVEPALVEPAPTEAAPVEPPAPVEPAPDPAHAGPSAADANTVLANASALAKTLSDKPKVLAFMSALMGIPGSGDT